MERIQSFDLQRAPYPASGDQIGHHPPSLILSHPPQMYCRTRKHQHCPYPPPQYHPPICHPLPPYFPPQYSHPDMQSASHQHQQYQQHSYSQYEAHLPPQQTHHPNNSEHPSQAPQAGRYPGTGTPPPTSIEYASVTSTYAGSVGDAATAGYPNTFQRSAHRIEQPSLAATTTAITNGANRPTSRSRSGVVCCVSCACCEAARQRVFDAQAELLRAKDELLRAKDELLQLYGEGRILPHSHTGAQTTPVSYSLTDADVADRAVRPTTHIPASAPIHVPTHAAGKLEVQPKIGDGSQEQAFGRRQIFLSYNWGSQEEVSNLKQILERNLGTLCWMDTSVMGGGQSLPGEICKGVREADVVVSCLTEKYIKSANCQKEISLSVDFKKPVIPLMLENVGWPVPVDGMQFAFAGKLFIEFMEPNSFDEDSKAMQQLLKQLPAFIELDAVTKKSPSGEHKIELDWGDSIRHEEVRKFWTDNFPNKNLVPEEEFRSKFEGFLQKQIPNSKLTPGDLAKVIGAFNPSRNSHILVDNIGPLFPPAQAVAYAVKNIINPLTHGTHGVVPDKNYVSLSIGRIGETRQLEELSSSPNVIFLCGETGVGKTHLATTVAHSMLEKHRLRHVLFVDCKGVLGDDSLLNRTLANLTDTESLSSRDKKGELSKWVKARKERYMIVLDGAEMAMQASERGEGEDDFLLGFVKTIKEFDTEELATIMITTNRDIPCVAEPYKLLQLNRLTDYDAALVVENRLGANNTAVRVISKLSGGIPLISRMLSAVVSLDYIDLESLQLEAKSITAPSACGWLLRVIKRLPSRMKECLMVSALFPGDVDPNIVGHIVGASNVRDEMVLLSHLELVKYYRYDTGVFSLRETFRIAIVEEYFIGAKLSTDKAVQWRQNYMKEISKIIKKAATLYITGRDVVGQTLLTAHTDDVKLFLDTVSDCNVLPPFSSDDAPLDLANFFLWRLDTSFICQIFSSWTDHVFAEYNKVLAERSKDKGQTFLRLAFTANYLGFDEIPNLSIRERVEELRDILRKFESMKLTAEEEPFKGLLWGYIALLEGKLGNSTLALEGYREEVNIIKRYKERPEVYSQLSRCYADMAFVHKSQGEYETAIEEYEKALDENNLPRSSHTVSTLLNEMGHVQYKRGRYDEAIKLVKEALQSRDQYFGLVSPSSLTSLNYLASIHITLNHFDEAEKLLRRSESILDHFDLNLRKATTLFVWGTLEEKRGRTDLAIKHYQDCLGLRKAEIDSPDHPELIEVEERLKALKAFT